ncbi:MAG: energy-coupling factor transporter transmembrane protein EcfT [Erysipelotrichaceae bacterium]
MNDLVFGRYIPLDSLIHKIDPRTKIIALLFLLVMIFLPIGYWGYAIIGTFLLCVILISKVDIKIIVKGLKPMMMMLVFLLVINVLIYKDGYVLLDILGFKIYSKAVYQTLFIAFRLVLMITTTTILTSTTKPLDLTLGLEKLLLPLKRVNFPTHEIAMIISIALRFIPTLIEQTQKIMKAQQSRGVDLEEGSFKEKINAILSLIVPLFICAFQTADDLAIAMEARGYNPSRPRTSYRVLKFKVIDGISIFIILILLGLLIWLMK